MVSEQRADVIEDVAARAVSVGLSFLPGPFSTVWDAVVGTTAERRLRRDIDEIKADLARVAEAHRTVDLKSVLSSERFLASFIATLQSMATTADVEKRRLLRNALINGAVLDVRLYSEYFTGLIRDYTIQHVALLKWASGLPPYRDEDVPTSGVWRDLVGMAVDALYDGRSESRPQAQRLVTRLTADGLLHREQGPSYGLLDTLEGNRPDALSPDGAAFLELLAQPLAEHAGNSHVS